MYMPKAEGRNTTRIWCGHTGGMMRIVIAG